MNPNTDIEPTIWKEITNYFHQATIEGVAQSKVNSHNKDFIKALKHSNEVFAAFKVHSMGVKMAQQLYDEKGQLRGYNDWRKRINNIASHQVGTWLNTEYNTAVIRAHQAADWQEFQRNKDILPNLKWMPTTSTQADTEHRIFWEKKLTLPIDHPFWEKHHPADRWNCKCSLEATSEPITDNFNSIIQQAPLPQRGLENNPKNGQLFSDKHPYFPEKCSKCSFYKKKSSLLNVLFRNKVKDCYHCEFIHEEINKTKESTHHYINDPVYGKRLQISTIADKQDLEDNIRVAKALLNSFSNIEVKICPHVYKKGVKNPELLINNLIGDNKAIQTEKGITNAFVKAIKQGCKTIVIDLDKHIKKLSLKKVSQYIMWRRENFEKKIIQECFIVYNNKAVCITLEHILENKIKDELTKIEP